MTKTNMPEHLLVSIREATRASIAPSRFVNPYVISRMIEVLRNRGEIWAESVLGRKFDRRSYIDPALPWLLDGEAEILIAADSAEDWYTAEKIGEIP